MKIVLPFLVLTIGLGAWRAWRRSRFYSLKTNAQLAAAFLLLVGGIVAIVLGSFGRSAGHTPVARLALMALAIILIFAIFIATVFRITEGKQADPPQGASWSDVHGRRLRPWIGYTSALLLLDIVATVFTPPSWIALPLTLGGIVLLLGTSVLYPLFLRARRYDRATTALLASPWVHWRYAPEQWKSWALIQRSWEQAQAPIVQWKQDVPQALFPIAVLGIATWILGDGGPAEKVGVFLACIAVLLSASFLMVRAARREPQRRFLRILGSPPEAILGAQGIYCGGELSPWSVAGAHLVEAMALHDPPQRLVLNFDSLRANGSGASRQSRMIPIPQGGERDLHQLQQQLKAACPQASVRLTPQF